jgi:Mg2+-importing ATPase
VDAAQLRKPQDWNVKLIRNYMLVFGTLSSLFDIITFIVLELVFHAKVHEFQSAWFLGSILTEVVVLFVLRTRRPFFRSRPSKWIVIASIVVALVSCCIPYSPLAKPLQLVGLSLPLFLSIIAITLVYVASNEIVKRIFWKPNQRTA